jgi:hypothetical protein
MGNEKVIKCNPVMEGVAEGEVLFSSQPISFYGGVDPKTGVVIEKGHELEGKCIANKILVFPHGKGSTVGSYVIYALKKNGKAPAAIINEETETIIATGVILASIPCVDGIDIPLLKHAKKVRVDATKGEITILE